MLTFAALGMLVYGGYSAVWAAVDLVRGARLELWAEAGLVMFGCLLVLSAALVRMRIPGGIAFATSAMLGLQALAVHNGAHLDNGLSPQIGRAVLAVALVAMAVKSSRARPAP